MFEKSNDTSISISTGTMVRAVLVAAGVYFIWFLRDLVLVMLTAIVIASFVDSATPYLKRMKINRVLGIAILYILFLLLLAGIFYLFAPLLITEVYNFSAFLSTYIPNSPFINYFQNEAFAGAKDIVANLSHSLSLTNLLDTSKAFITNLSGGFFQTLSAAFGSIFNVGLIIFLSFYLSIQEKGIENFLKIIFPIEHEDYVVDLWTRSSHKIALWVKGQMLLGLLIGVLTYLVLSLLGVQYALLLAIISAITELVPYGILVALVIAVSFTFVSSGVGTAAMVGVAYIIIHQFELFLFSPLVIKKAVGLSPIVIILAAVVGFELDGFWGLVLAIPFAVILMELINDVEKHKLSARGNGGQNEKK